MTAHRTRSLALLLFACSLSARCFSGSVLAESAQPPIKIGATLALTGKLAFSGTAHEKGLSLALEDINKAGGINGRMLELIVEDNGGDPKSALGGVNKMLSSDQVDLIFSPFSHITQTVKDPVKRAGKLMIYAASLNQVATESPLFFRDWGDGESQGASLARAVAKFGYTKVAFLTEISEGCLLIENSFKKEAAARNLDIVSQESYAPGETDFKPQLLRISQRKPQTIATCTWRDSFLIMPQLKSLGLIKIPTFQMLALFLPASDTPEIRKLYEENHTVAVWLGFIDGALTEKQKHFFTRLAAKGDQSPRIEAALGYDDMMVLAAALRACPKEVGIDPKCVAQEMAKTVYEGIGGTLRFDELRRSNREDLLVRVVNGAWVQAF